MPCCLEMMRKRSWFSVFVIYVFWQFSHDTFFFMYIKVSWVLEFLQWWFKIIEIFGQKLTSSKEVILFFKKESMRLKCEWSSESFWKWLSLQLNKYETDPYILQIFQSNTPVCLIISVFCESCEPMLCEPEIVQKFCSWCQWG